MNNVCAALRSLSYSEVKTGIWMKPVGFHLFAFRESDSMWLNYFLAGTGEILVWESKTVEPNDLNDVGAIIHCLKHWEAYTRINIAASAQSEFQISTIYHKENT